MTIKRPVVTEKTLNLYKNSNKVTFEVDSRSNKTEAKKALESVYSVKVGDVSVTNRLGKYKVNRLTKKISKLKDRKIMVFSLTEGKIDIFETKE